MELSSHFSCCFNSNDIAHYMEFHELPANASYDLCIGGRYYQVSLLASNAETRNLFLNLWLQFPKPADSPRMSPIQVSEQINHCLDQNGLTRIVFKNVSFIPNQLERHDAPTREILPSKKAKTS